MKRSSLLLLAALVLNISLYFPLLSPTIPSVELSLQGSPLHVAIQSPGIVYLTLATMTIIVPVLLEFLLDNLLFGFNRASIERSLLILSVFCTSLAQFIGLHTNVATALYGISIYGYLWLLFSIGFIVLNRISPKAFTTLRILTILCFTYIYFISESLFLMLEDQKLVILINVSKYLTVSSFIFLILYFFFMVISDFYSSKTPFRIWMKSVDNDTQLAILLSLTLLLAGALIVCLSLAFVKDVGIQNSPSSFIDGYLCISVITSLLLTAVPQRIERYQLSKVVSDLEIKKTFVRYISHELRTPLSIIMTGLSLLEEQLQSEGGLREALSTIEELKQPCRTGVGILDDLLDYEKLESGIAYIEKSSQDPSFYFEVTIAPFRLVARQKNIQLNIRNSIRRGQYLVDIDETKVSIYTVLSKAH